MGRVREKAKCEYEALRQARMLENKARLESLGVANAISQLRKAKKTRPYNKRVYGLTPLRRSRRLNNNFTAATAATPNHLPLRRSHRLRHTPTPPSSPKQEKLTLSEEKDEQPRPANAPLIQLTEADLQISAKSSARRCNSKGREKLTLSEEKDEQPRPANAPLIQLTDADLQISAESSARRCNNKGRGSVYNPVLGICCHFCRQKKLCGEEDCKRCGNFDVNEPCLGKTDCSVCHSSTGVFCRACLKIRYGEEIEEVRENKGWMCPHCIEEKGTNPYWICNSSICLRKRKRPPTGIAIYKAREMGYKSVAHLIMEELKRGRM